MNKGKIIQIMGPVVDVAFPDELPAIKEALEVQLDGKRLVMEVSQTCRCSNLNSPYPISS